MSAFINVRQFVIMSFIIAQTCKILFYSSTSPLHRHEREHEMSDDSSEGYAWQQELSDPSAAEDLLSGAQGDEESDEGRPAQPWLVVNLV